MLQGAVLSDRLPDEDPLLNQEIFGPILPILTYGDFDALLGELKREDSPLALYLFTGEKKRKTRVARELSFGGGCINDTVIHLATSEMGFGGVGNSGMGAYHGKVGFDAFSHRKSMVDKGTGIDLAMRYRPYGSRLSKWLTERFLR